MTQDEMLQRITARYPHRWVGTVRWITTDGQHKQQQGKVIGKATGTKGGQYLVIRATDGREIYAGFKAICRALAKEEQDRKIRQAVAGQFCRECGKRLDYLDDHSGLEGYCFNCV